MWLGLSVWKIFNVRRGFLFYFSCLFSFVKGRRQFLMFFFFLLSNHKVLFDMVLNISEGYLVLGEYVQILPLNHPPFQLPPRPIIESNLTLNRSHFSKESVCIFGSWNGTFKNEIMIFFPASIRWWRLKTENMASSSYVPCNFTG